MFQVSGRHELNRNREVFFELVRAGLWEKEARLSQFGDIDYAAILQLAEEQSVVGLVTAGLEHVMDVKVPQEWLLQFIGETLQIEQKNKEMNAFIAELIEKLRNAGVYALLVKGQGVAQCYEKPLWRASGDVDLLLSDSNFEKARVFLTPLASEVETENKYERHLAMTIDSWVVELHGSLRCGLSAGIDAGLDAIKNDTFYGGSVSSWLNNRTQIFMLSKTNDAIYVFTHFLAHFYKGGVGIRQICDWARLLWANRSVLDVRALESKLCRMGLISEWKAFGAFVVEYLGMPADAMPLLNGNDNLKRKTDKICSFIMEVGNFGHNRDTSYYSKYPFLLRKAISLWHRIEDLGRHATIFPMDSFRFFPYMMLNGLREAVRGK